MKKKAIISIISVITAIVMLFTLTSCDDGQGSTSDTQSTTDSTEAPDYSALLDDAANGDVADGLTKYVERMNISGSVLVIDNGKTILDFAQGDFKGKGSDILYGVASITKQITAACIMKLYEEEELDIDDKLSDYFPEYRFGKKITIRQLLCQQSGIPDYSVESQDGAVWTFTDNSSYKVMLKPENSAETNRKLIRDLVFGCNLLFEPGSEFYYSDSNYAILATIVEDVSGKSYHDYVRENIFKPLKMNASFIDDYDYKEEVVIAGTDREEFDDDYFKYKGAEFGCGDMLACAMDLYKWYNGFTSYKVVSKSSYNLMTENYSSKDELGYGFGLMISEGGDCKTLYHYGFIPSYYSSMFMIPKHDLFVAVLANHAKGYPQTAAHIIVETYARASGYNISGIE